MAEPEPLSNALGRVLRLHNVQPPDPADPEEIERNLLEVPLLPAGAYGAQLEYHRQIQRSREATDADRRAASGDITRLERLLAAAELRERLMRGRPERCFCYGLGGMQKRWLRMFEGDEVVAVPTWSIWCTCPEAQEQQAARERMLAEQRRQQLQRNAERLFGSMPERFKAWTFETLLAESTAHASVVEPARQWLASGKWMLFMRGPVGTGKTGVGVAVTKQALEMGLSVLYVDVIDMLGKLRDSFSSREAFAESDDGLRARWNALQGVEVLLVDDLGAERHKRNEDVDWPTETLWQLLNHRHGARLRTIVTSNHSLNELAEKFGHPRLPSRMGEDAIGLNFTGLPMLREP
ncbi:MAG TPA: ATP-binding protein [Chloroflexota bacterium]|jgi:DNA replication protein DnaC